jgi:hypothetical protein
MMQIKFLVVVLAVLLILPCGCAQQSIREEDNPLLLTVEELTLYGLSFENYRQYEVFRRNISVDGAIEVEYEFDPPDDCGINLYLSVTASFEPTEGDAKLAYLTELKGTTLGAKLGGVTVTESKEFFAYGDESFFGFLMGEKGPGGNAFITRTGTKVYAVLIGGVFFDSRDDWAELITPKLQYLESYSP